MLCDNRRQTKCGFLAFFSSLFQHPLHNVNKSLQIINLNSSPLFHLEAHSLRTSDIQASIRSAMEVLVAEPVMRAVWAWGPPVQSFEIEIACERCRLYVSFGSKRQWSKLDPKAENKAAHQAREIETPKKPFVRERDKIANVFADFQHCVYLISLRLISLYCVH